MTTLVLGAKKPNCWTYHIVCEVKHQLSPNNVLDVTKSGQETFNRSVQTQVNAIKLMKEHSQLDMGGIQGCL